MIRALALVAAGAGYECWPSPRKLARQASQGVLATAPNRAVNWHPGMRASCQLTLSKLSPAGPSSDNRPTSANTPRHRIQQAAYGFKGACNGQAEAMHTLNSQGQKMRAMVPFPCCDHSLRSTDREQSANTPIEIVWAWLVP